MNFPEVSRTSVGRRVRAAVLMVPVWAGRDDA